MADFVICPRCRRQNPADSVFCNRCGVRLLSAGVYYRSRDSSASVGMGQMLLGLGVLILAGVVLGGGAILLLGASPRPTPTNAAVVPAPTGTELPSFSTPSPSPVLAPSPTLPTPPPTPLAPTPTPSPEPTLAPTPTPQPTPSPTPVDCAVASTGANIKSLRLGLGDATQKGPLAKVWCIRSVVIDGWSGYGTARLMSKNRVIYGMTCLPSGCSDTDFVPYQVDKGRTLSYDFACYDDPGTPDPIDECTDSTPDGATITITYEPIAGP